ncbi:MAG: hypothetical protein CMJ58_05710 [Planctomycetaceae bacterium]|nr:hypothetical protein [Planctomycetaceae bacterium]
MALFAQFLLRLTFGLAAAMWTVSPRLVASGYFRNHLYVTLGTAAMASLLLGTLGSWGMAAAIVAAVASYAGAVCWLYESPRAGRALLFVVAVAALLAAGLADDFQATQTPAYQAAAEAAEEEATVVKPSAAYSQAAAALRGADRFSSGLLLGAVTASMLLGHWYLNAPGMKLEPLNDLIKVIAVVVVLQACVSGAALYWLCGAEGHGWPDTGTLAMIAGRWAFGLVGVAALAWMARETLKIPNTQSATGILYVAVIGAFAGEMLSLMLAAQHAYPL